MSAIKEYFAAEIEQAALARLKADPIAETERFFDSLYAAMDKLPAGYIRRTDGTLVAVEEPL